MKERLSLVLFLMGREYARVEMHLKTEKKAEVKTNLFFVFFSLKIEKKNFLRRNFCPNGTEK